MDNKILKAIIEEDIAYLNQSLPRDKSLHISLDNCSNYPELATNSPTSLLQLACHFKAKTTLKWLLERGANPNIYYSGQNTVLAFAVSTNNLEAVKILITHGANPNFALINNTNLLQYTCSVEVFNYLIPLIENPFQTDDFGQTALHSVCNTMHYDGKIELIEALLDYGFDMHQKDESGINSLEKLTCMGFNNELSIHFLVEKGARLNEQKNDGNTLLHLLCLEPLWKVNEFNINALLQNQADISLKNNNGKTAFELYIKLEDIGDWETIKLFIDKGEPIQHLAELAKNSRHLISFINFMVEKHPTWLETHFEVITSEINKEESDLALRSYIYGATSATHFLIKKEFNLSGKTKKGLTFKELAQKWNDKKTLALLNG